MVYIFLVILLLSYILDALISLLPTASIFTRLYNNKTLYSFLRYGKIFYTKRGLSNPLPGAGLLGETEICCWLGKMFLGLVYFSYSYYRILFAKFS